MFIVYYIVARSLRGHYRLHTDCSKLAQVNECLLLPSCNHALFSTDVRHYVDMTSSHIAVANDVTEDDLFVTMDTSDMKLRHVKSYSDNEIATRSRDSIIDDVIKSQPDILPVSHHGNWLIMTSLYDRFACVTILYWTESEPNQELVFINSFDRWKHKSIQRCVSG